MKKEVLMSLVVLAIIGTSAVFAQEPTLDKLRFVDNRKGGYEVSAANTNITGAVVVPDTYNGKPVVDVSTFTGCNEITSITYPAGVRIIHGNANLLKVTSITFQGSDITGQLFNLPGDLQAKYKAGGAGTYTREAGGKTWTKQGGFTLNGTWKRSDGMEIIISGDGTQIFTITGNAPNNGGRFSRNFAER
jgi:hypothetical protein